MSLRYTWIYIPTVSCNGVIMTSILWYRQTTYEIDTHVTSAAAWFPCIGNKEFKSQTTVLLSDRLLAETVGTCNKLNMKSQCDFKILVISVVYRHQLHYICDCWWVTWFYVCCPQWVCNSFDTVITLRKNRIWADVFYLTQNVWKLRFQTIWKNIYKACCLKRVFHFQILRN